MNLATFGRRMGSFAAAAAITLTCGLWTHDASADNRVGEFVTNAADWTYAPVITRLPSGSGGNVITVDNVLAVAKPGIANGENLIAVWYVRENAGGTTWAAKTWEDTTWAGIAQRLKDDLGLTDEELAIFGQGPTGSAAASAPLTYTGGFVAGDAMEPIVNGSDPNSREMLVEILKDTGYKIADPVFDAKSPCTTSEKLEQYASLSKNVAEASSMPAKVSLLQVAYAEIDTCLEEVLSDSDSAVPNPVEVPGTFVPLPNGPAEWVRLPALVPPNSVLICIEFTRKVGTVTMQYWVIGRTQSCMFECTVDKYENVTCCGTQSDPPSASAPDCYPNPSGEGESTKTFNQNPIVACGFQLCP